MKLHKHIILVVVGYNMYAFIFNTWVCLPVLAVGTPQNPNLEGQIY